MTNSKQLPRFEWQNMVLRESVYPFRMKKLREFLLFYWEAETLAEMKKASAEERKKFLSEVAVEITAQRQEWQDQFEAAFVELTANDKWFAMKTTEKYQLWYLQDQIRYTKNSNWERVRRLLDLFEQKDKLPPAINLNGDPNPKDVTRARLAIEEKRLAHMSHDNLLKAILDRFDADPDRYPQWYQYMVVHFSGMRYKSAHGSWADPKYLLELIGQNNKFTIPDVPEPDTMPIPANQTALEQLKLLEPKIPSWMWKNVVRFTPLQIEEVTENDTDWEVYPKTRNEPGFDNNFWRNTFTKWYKKDITQWRAHHQATLDLIVNRAVCNEVSEHILHMRWLRPSGGLNFKVDWYRHRAKKTEELPANHPRKVIFKRATSVADFQPGASIFWLGWYPQPPNSANFAYPISDFNFFPDGINMNGGSKKKRPKGKGGRLDVNGWKYGYEGNWLVRTRKLNEQEIQVQLNAKKRDMDLQRRREIKELKNQIAQGQPKNKKNKSQAIRKKEKKLNQLENNVQFNKQVEREGKKLRRTLAKQEVKQILRWRHEASVVSVEEMTSGHYVWTFETETEIGLNRRYLYDLIGTDNNDDYQVFVGYMPSLDNLPADKDPEEFLSRTFMTREHASKMKQRLKEMLRRDWILPGRYPEKTYANPPKLKPITEPPEPTDVIANLPPSEQHNWVKITPPKKKGFLINKYYKKRNKKKFPIMIPTPFENRQRLARGTLVGVSPNHKETATDPGDGTIRADGRDNYFYRVTFCEDYHDAVGTFIEVGYTADVADPVAYIKEQKKNKPAKRPKKIDELIEGIVDPDDEKEKINCWEKKKAKTISGLPAFKLPSMKSRLQLEEGWKVTVHSRLTGDNGYFHEIEECGDLQKAKGLYVRDQNIDLPVEAIVDPEDESKKKIDCWEKKEAKTSNDLPAFELPAMRARVQLEEGWKVSVHSALDTDSGKFHEIERCADLEKAKGLYVRAQDIELPGEAEEAEKVEEVEEPKPMVV
jgi:hypothetical protein